MKLLLLQLPMIITAKITNISLTYFLQIKKLQLTETFRIHLLVDLHQLQKNELQNWKAKDVKGLRRSLYIKHIAKANDKIMVVKEKSDMEKAREHTDNYPCLDLRKSLMKLRMYFIILYSNSYSFIQQYSARIINSPIFEGITIFVIVSNSVTLALEDPTDKTPPEYADIVDDVYLGLYTLELILKIMGMGFLFNKGAYLRDTWNILDFIIVASAYITIFLGSSSSSDFKLSGLRAFRVLRPLRTISSVEGLKILVTALLSALPLLRDTVIILVFFFLIYAIGGVQLLSGYLKRRCVFAETGVAHEDDILCGGSASCPPDYFCGKRMENPNGGVTNFDNMLYGILTVFQSVTLEGWSYVMVDVQRVFGVISILFFIPLVFIGAFFLLNLTLAVINSKFTEAHKEQKEKNKLMKLNQKKHMIKRGMKQNDYILNLITIRQFQMAKKAARLMIKFLRRRQRLKKAIIDKDDMITSGRDLDASSLDDTSKNLLMNNSILNEQATTTALNQLMLRQEISLFNSPIKKNATQGSSTMTLPFLKNNISSDTTGLQSNISTLFAFNQNNQSASKEESKLSNINPSSQSQFPQTNPNPTTPVPQKLGISSGIYSKQVSKLTANEDKQHETIHEEDFEEEDLSSCSDDHDNVNHQEIQQRNGGNLGVIKGVGGSFHSIQSLSKSMMSQDESVTSDEEKKENEQSQPKGLHNKVGEVLMEEEKVKFESDEAQTNSPDKTRIKILRTSNFLVDNNKMHAPQDGYRQLVMSGNWGIATATQSIKALDTINSSEQMIPIQFKNDKFDHFQDLDKFITIEDVQPQNINQQVQLEMIHDLNSQSREENEYGIPSVSSQVYLRRNSEENKTSPNNNQNRIEFHKYDIEVLESVIDSDSDLNYNETLRRDNISKFQQSRQVISTIDRIVLQKPIFDPPQIAEVNEITQAPSIQQFKKQWTVNLQQQQRFKQKNQMIENSPSIRRAETKVLEPKSNQRLNDSNEQSQHQGSQIEISNAGGNKLFNRSLRSESISPAVRTNALEDSMSYASKSVTQASPIKSQQLQLKPSLNFSSLHNKIVSQLSKTVHQQTINSKRKKLQIQKNQQFESTSQNDVFEKRVQVQEKRWLTDQYKFVKIPKDMEAQLDPDYEEFKFVRSKYKPYQQKIIYDIESDEEEDDFTLLMNEESKMMTEPQPFETVTGIGYHDFFTKLPTQQITRRSDLITTSTLSITYQPKQRFNRKQLQNIKHNDTQSQFHHQPAIKRSNSHSNSQIDILPEEIQSYKPLRTTINRTERMQRKSMQIFLKRQNSKDIEGLNRSIGSGSHFGQRSQTFKEPITPKSQLKHKMSSSSSLSINFNKNHRKGILPQVNNINLQAQIKQLRFHAKKMQLKQEQFSNKKFTMKDAEKIFAGTFYSDDEDDNNNKQKEETEKEDLGKSVFLTKNQFNLMDIRDDKQILREFECQALQQLQNYTDQQKEAEKQNRSQNMDEVPSNIREELSLPDDIQGQDLDMYEIRIRDSSYKKKHPKWSGQDILSGQGIDGKRLIDEERSRWVIQQMNAIRIWPKGLKGHVKKFRYIIKKIVKSPFFENLMLLSVLINTILLGMDRYDIPHWEQVIMTGFNNFFTGLFITELGLKLIALGPKKYLSDRMNYLDGIVVIISIVELIINSTGNSSRKNGLQAIRTVRIFRTFRVLRVARLLRTLHSMQMIMGVITRSMASFIYIALLLLLFIFIFALLGMQIFGGQFHYEEGEAQIGSYDTFNSAFITVFQVLTIENWQQILFVSMQSNLGKIVPAIFYISWIFIGNFILLNLFLAILLDSFIEEEQETEDQEQQRKQEIQDKQSMQQQQLLLKKSNSMNMKDKQQKKLEMKQKRIKDRDQKRKSIMMLFQEKQDENESGDEEDDERDLEDMDEEDIFKILEQEGIQTQNTEGDNNKSSNLNSLKQYKALKCQNSFYIFSKQFNLNFITLKAKISENVDLIFTILFTMESIVKAVSLGFIMEPNSYLRETWNMLDFFIVCSSLIDLALTEIDLPFIKILRLLRTLRPLRFISHNIAMKMIVNALFESVGHIINVMIVVMIVWLMFAILGVNLFAGKFFYCSIEPYVNRTRLQCLKNDGVWKPYDSNFDNVGSAMMTLFIVASLEGWPDIMKQAVDSTEVDKGPIMNYSPLNAYYFVAFIFVGSYFFLNFFIGVLFLKYNDAQKAETAGFTEEHLSWLDMQRMILSARPDFETTNVPSQKWRKHFHKFVSSNQFDIFIMVCIVANMIQMACVYEGASDVYLERLDIINLFFTSVFTLECILKLIGYGRSYFRSSLNKFDFIIVISSLIDVSMSFFTASDLRFLRVGPQLARVLRVFRVSRILRLVGKYEGLQALIQTITFSLPSLMNVLGLLLLIFFMFSVLGVFFFSQITKGVVINEYMNFSNFGLAMLMLFRMSTGEDWNLVMYDCAREKDCIQGENCGSMWVAYIYNVFFKLICTDVMLNLFVLVILQQFDKYYLPKDNIINKFKMDLQGFKDTWKAFTMERYNCQKIKESQLTSFFQVLKSPLGMPNLTEMDLQKNMLKMGIKSDPDGYIYFNELLYRCMRRVYGQLKLNKKMQIQEIKTQYKVVSMTLQQQRKGRKIQNQEILRHMAAKTSSVNPFLTVMIFKVSFKVWFNHTIKTRQKQKQRKSLRRKSAKSLLTFKEENPSIIILLETLKPDEQKETKKDQQIEEDKPDVIEFDYYEDQEVLISYVSENENNEEQKDQEQSYQQQQDQEQSFQSSISNYSSFSRANNSQKGISQFQVDSLSPKSQYRIKKSQAAFQKKQQWDHAFSSQGHLKIVPLDYSYQENTLNSAYKRNIIDVIEEEDELQLQSMPSIQKRRKSDKQFKFL